MNCSARFFSTGLAAAALLAPSFPLLAQGAEDVDAATKNKVKMVAPEDRVGCIWKIQGEDHTTFLAGSIHMLRQQDHPVSLLYDQAYEASDEIVFEVDVAEMTSRKGVMKMQLLSMYTDGDSLDKHLSAKAMKRLRTYLDGHAMGRMMALGLPRLKPGMVFLSISQLEAVRMNAKPELGLELTYFAKAKQDGKPSSGLETLEFQMTLFDGFSDEEVETLIMKTLDEVDEMPKMIDELIALWHAGDLEELDKLLSKDMEDDKKLREVILTERNANWIPAIEEAIEGQKSILFIVGSAHLIGKDSVVDLLRKKGYKVERVTRETAKAELKKAA